MKKWYLVALSLSSLNEVLYGMQQATLSIPENRTRSSSNGIGIDPWVRTSSSATPARRIQLSGGSPRASSSKCSVASKTITHSNDEQELWTAVNAKNFDTAQLLLEAKKTIRINEPDAQGRTLLMTAIIQEDPDTVILLLNHDAVTHIEDSKGISAIMHAMNIKNSDLALEIAGYLYQVDPDTVLQSTTHDKTPIMYALETGNEAFVDFLLERGAQKQLTLQMVAKCQNPALMQKVAPLLHRETIACGRPLSPSRRIQLVRQIKPNAHENLTQSARNSQDLNSAITAHNTDKALELLSDETQNFRIDTPDTAGITKLMAATDAAQVEVVIELLNRNASPHSEDFKSLSVFMHTMNLKDSALALEIAHYLQQVDPSITTRATRNGKTPLAYAFETNNEPFVTFLLEHGAKEQLTIHMAAACTDHKLGLKFAKPYINNKQLPGPNEVGRTVLMNACRAGNDALVTLLLEAGQDPNAQDVSGNSALFYTNWCSEKSQAITVTTLLLKYGANKALKNSMKMTAAEAAYDPALKKLLQP